MMAVLIKNGRVIDPYSSLDAPKDILIDKGKIKAIEAPESINNSQVGKPLVIDARGCVVSPGFIDMHVHFREPGFEYKETIESGCQSAAAGGFTSVAVMPNTKPVNDTRSVTELILAQAQAKGIVNVHAIAAITQGLAGERLSEMADLKDAGAIAFSDDGRSPASPCVIAAIACTLTIPFAWACAKISSVTERVSFTGFVLGMTATEVKPPAAAD
jgi:dihydroorotase